LIDISWLLTQLDRAAWLETNFQAGARSLTFNPGHFVVQTISLLWHTRTTIHYAQGTSKRTYSPMILTNTRFRRRPSRLPGQPFRLASKDPLPGARVETAIGHGHHHGFAWRPITRNTARCVALQVRVGIVASLLSG
jgi:hypothetical protein